MLHFDVLSAQIDARECALASGALVRLLTSVHNCVMIEVILIAEPLPAGTALKAAVGTWLRTVHRAAAAPTLHGTNDARLRVNSVSMVNQRSQRCLPRYALCPGHRSADDHASRRRQFPEMPRSGPETNCRPEALG